MKISLLADCRSAAPMVAQWYFDEWAHKKPEETIESITDKILLGANRVEIPIMYLGYFKSELIGAGEIKHHSLEAYPEYDFWLDGIYVVPTHRGRGFSTQLIEYAKEKAIELDALPLYLRCTAENIKLYEARGFKVITPEDNKFIMVFQIRP